MRISPEKEGYDRFPADCSSFNVHHWTRQSAKGDNEINSNVQQNELTSFSQFCDNYLTCSLMVDNHTPFSGTSLLPYFRMKYAVWSPVYLPDIPHAESMWVVQKDNKIDNLEVHT